MSPSSETARARLVPRRRRPVLWLSAVLHALALAALIFYPRAKPPDEGLGPPSISVMLEPSDLPSTSPTPTPQAATGAPDAEVVQRAAPPDTLGPITPQTAEAPRPAQSEAAAAPAPAVEPSLPPLAFAQPAAPPPAARSAAPTAPRAAEPPAPTEPAPVPIPASPAPPAATAAPAPATVTPRVAPAPVPPTPMPPVREALVQPPMPRPLPRPQTRPAQPPRDSSRSAFPMPSFSSLGGAFPESRQAARAPSREMAGPVKLSVGPSQLRGNIAGDDLGPGWGEMLMAWVNAHKHYPEQAIENGEDGDVSVNLVIARDGRVQSVDLRQRSGSIWLDAALQGLFRSKRLPPLPDSFGEQTAQIQFTMHYILVR